ncbi:cellulose binding domain-containing protein [Hamadaea tsunoensis]|uniref:cellulose binding domain-containing protein n=1 Tax=Hamadaea tsunoensis TaxID=53368 RepID=UPI000483BFD3|nr:cellulose binding domain-containing protein [Hamadaea tsunoensis]
MLNGGPDPAWRSRLITSGIRQVNYSEGLSVGYKWYDSHNIAPQFEFGYGLSYTTFSYSNLSLTTTGTDATTKITATFTVTNTGIRAGSEVPQVYLNLPTSAGESKRLVCFNRITLAAGAQTQVSTTIDAASPDHPFGMWDTTNHRWINVSGGYLVSAGSSSRQLPLVASANLTFTNQLPSTSPSPWVSPSASASPSASPTPSTSPSASPTATPTGCTATYTLQGGWPGEFQAEVRITAGTAAITRWTVTMTWANGQQVNSAWNAIVTTNGTVTTAKNESYNGNLAAGTSTTFGFIGKISGSTNNAPTLTCSTT